MTLLEDPGTDDAHRVLAALALQRLGPAAVAAGPALMRMMQGDRSFRRAPQIS